MNMAKMFIKTIPLTAENSPLTWSDEKYHSLIDNNTLVGYLLSSKHNTMSLNLYLLPPTSFYEGSLESIHLTHPELKTAFLQWLEVIVENEASFQFRNPPLDLWLETRLNWINALCLKIHNKYGTDINEATSTAYMTILKLYRKGNVYIGNLHYLEIAIHTSIKKEHYYMKNRLSGKHKDAIHLDAGPGDFNASISDDVTDFHEILMMPTWVTEEEKRYDEIWDRMKADLVEDFSEREIDQICKGSAFMVPSLYRRLLAWRKEHDLEDYL